MTPGCPITTFGHDEIGGSALKSFDLQKQLEHAKIFKHLYKFTVNWEDTHAATSLSRNIPIHIVVNIVVNA